MGPKRKITSATTEDLTAKGKSKKNVAAKGNVSTSWKSIKFEYAKFGNLNNDLISTVVTSTASSTGAPTAVTTTATSTGPRRSPSPTAARRIRATMHRRSPSPRKGSFNVSKKYPAKLSKSTTPTKKAQAKKSKPSTPTKRTVKKKTKASTPLNKKKPPTEKAETKTKILTKKLGPRMKQGKKKTRN